MFPTADPGAAGHEMYRLLERLSPLHPSITGDGLRALFALLAEEVPLRLAEVPSGTPVLDWTVPPEWNVREAWLEGPDGRRVADLADTPLAVVQYSEPVDAELTLEELRPRLHSLPGQPELVPYRTSYWSRTWGFCLPHRILERLPPGRYRAHIDATLGPGHLTYAECVLPGAVEEEVLISCYSCHPSLANDNLSGVALAWALARALRGRPLRRTHRFLWSGGTIGPLTWLARNPEVVPRVVAGLVLVCVGDRAPLSYKRSRRGDATVDRAAALVLRASAAGDRIAPWSPYGGDERQFCSPGFDLPVGVLMRSPHGEFPEYHTSADDLTVVTPEALGDSFRAALEILEILESDRRYLNLSPHGEPQLGRRGLYRQMGGVTHSPEDELALLWVLNQSDGAHSLLDVSERSGLPYPAVRRAAERLVDAALLRLSPATRTP